MAAGQHIWRRLQLSRSSCSQSEAALMVALLALLADQQRHQVMPVVEQALRLLWQMVLSASCSKI
jgi:hypothetical protein